MMRLSSGLRAGAARLSAAHAPAARRAVSARSGDGPSASGRGVDCGGGGGGVGFGTLRKGFKPQKRTTSSNAPSQVLNGRDKAEVLRDTQEEARLLQEAAAARSAAARLLQAAGAAQAAAGTQAAAAVDWTEDWKRVDAKVNTYPDTRLFTAVGSGGEEFRDAMVACVEAVIGARAPVSVRPSSQGKYLSVRVGPVVVQNRDQVLAVFLKMREDKRLKFHL
ncbi:hypothetical protein TSOC_009575 [Tetrabaena socialis]|uniref:Uncharacterized protein n=1 Tax=Tetrabaena socialis TaxID=47790 RepID=A0A2J7ZVH3_9CHLO|nr:hypothetical protein TSOC_009575 [Tetrabaena socialis]|eukprot:PNH04281.1 hypothetical protein TSOC_009575 [Tetrabaena socialis]